MGLKYELTDETLSFGGHLLHRIKRLSDGKLGGWIESEKNLSQDGDCWIDDEAKVYDKAEVFDGAQVYGNAEIHGEAWICDYAKVYGNAEVYDYTKVYGYAKVFDNAKVGGDARIRNEARVYGDALVHGNAEVGDEAHVYGNAEVYGNSKIYGIAWVYGDAKVYDTAKIHGDKKINSGKYTIGEYYADESSNSEVEDAIQDFVYEVDSTSSKLALQTEYDYAAEFFSSPITNDIKLDTLVVYTVDAKEPLIKIIKVKTEDKTNFKFVVDIVGDDNDSFTLKSIVKSQAQMYQLIQQTIDALRLYQKFSTYADDLEDYLRG